MLRNTTFQSNPTEAGFWFVAFHDSTNVSVFQLQGKCKHLVLALSDVSSLIRSLRASAPHVSQRKTHTVNVNSLSNWSFLLLITKAIQHGLIRLLMLQAIHWNPIMGATALLKSHGTHSTSLILVSLNNPNTDLLLRNQNYDPATLSSLPCPEIKSFIPAASFQCLHVKQGWKKRKSTVPLNRGLAEQFNIPTPFFLTCIDLCHKLNAVHKKSPEKAPDFNLSALIRRAWRRKKKKHFL